MQKITIPVKYQNGDSGYVFADRFLAGIRISRYVINHGLLYSLESIRVYGSTIEVNQNSN